MNEILFSLFIVKINETRWTKEEINPTTCFSFELSNGFLFCPVCSTGIPCLHLLKHFGFHLNTAFLNSEHEHFLHLNCPQSFCQAPVEFLPERANSRDLGGEGDSALPPPELYFKVKSWKHQEIQNVAWFLVRLPEKNFIRQLTRLADSPMFLLSSSNFTFTLPLNLVYKFAKFLKVAKSHDKIDFELVQVSLPSPTPFWVA